MVSSKLQGFSRLFFLPLKSHYKLDAKVFSTSYLFILFSNTSDSPKIPKYPKGRPSMNIQNH